MRLVEFFVQGMLSYVIALLPVYICLRFVYLGIRRQKPVWPRELLFATLAAYGIALVSQTLMPHNFYGVGDFEIYFQSITSGYRSYNLVPLQTVWAYLFTQNDRVSDWGSVAFLNLAANVALFVPLGLLAAFSSDRFHRFRNVLLLALSASLAIEAAQFLIGRRADIDDVILNVIGVCIGFGMWVLFVRTRGTLWRVDAVESGLAAGRSNPGVNPTTPCEVDSGRERA